MGNEHAMVASEVLLIAGMLTVFVGPALEADDYISKRTMRVVVGVGLALAASAVGRLWVTAILG